VFDTQAQVSPAVQLMLGSKELYSAASAVCPNTQERGRPYVIVFCGVNGVGKSTNLAKIAYWLGQHNIKVLIAACDTFRAGAPSTRQHRSRGLAAPLATLWLSCTMLSSRLLHGGAIGLLQATTASNLQRPVSRLREAHVLAWPAHNCAVLCV